MKKYYDKQVENLLNKLMNLCFYSNLVADDIAYQLQTTLDLDQAGEIYHTNFAHWFTGDSAADLLSSIMITSNIQPKRESLKKDEVTYGNITEAFEKNVQLFEELRRTTIDTIDELEYDVKNKQLIIQLEDFLVSVIGMLRKSNIVASKARSYENDNEAYKFEHWFSEFMS